MTAAPMPRLALFLLLLVLPAAAAAADLSLGPPIPIAPLATGAAPYSANIREIVPTGDGYVAFWSDPSRTIFATRLDAGGRPAGAAVALARSQEPLRVFDAARRGDGFLLAWDESDMTKVVFLDAELRPLREPTLLPQRAVWDVACGSERCVVTYATNSARELHLSITTLDGAAWESRLLVATPENDRMSAKITAGAEGFGIAAMVDDALQLIVLDRRGAEISRRYVGAKAYSAGIAARGQEYVVGWIGEWEVLGASFDQAGAPLLEPRRIDTPLRPRFVTIEVAATQNETVFVVPRDFSAVLITGASPPSHLYAVTMDARLESARTTLLTDADHHSWIADLATNGRGFVAAWNTYETPGFSPPVARIAAIGAQAAALSDAAGAAVSLRYGPLDQFPARIAMAGDVSLAVYVETDVGVSRLYGVRVRRGGEIVDRTPLLLASTVHLPKATISTDGRNFLVAWYHDWTPSGAPPVTTLVSVDAITGTVRTTGRIDNYLGAPVWSGSSYLAMAGSGPYEPGSLVRIAADGSVISTTSMPFPQAALAVAGGRVAAVNYAPRFEPFLLDDATGLPGLRMTLPQPSDTVRFFGGQRTFLLLYTRRDGPLQATRVDLEGRALDVRADGSMPLLFFPQRPAWSWIQLHAAPVGAGWLVAAYGSESVSAEAPRFAAVQQFFADGTTGDVVPVGDCGIAALASAEGRATLLCSSVDSETGVQRAVIREIWFDSPRQRPVRR